MNTSRLLKGLLFAVLATIVGGCATPIGKFTDEDFVWSHREVDDGYQAVYRTIFTTSKECGGIRTEGNLYTDVRQGTVDIYLVDVFGGRSPWVLGTVRIEAQADDRTQISVGVNRSMDNPLLGKKGGQRETIMRWADGISGCS